MATHFRYGVICHGHGIPEFPSCGIVELSEEEYIRQLGNPDNSWQCPTCKASADWDDDSCETAEHEFADGRCIVCGASEPPECCGGSGCEQCNGVSVP